MEKICQWFDAAYGRVCVCILKTLKMRYDEREQKLILHSLNPSPALRQFYLFILSHRSVHKISLMYSPSHGKETRV